MQGLIRYTLLIIYVQVYSGMSIYLFPLACCLEQLVAGTINDCPIALFFKLESTFLQIRIPLVLTSKISFPYSLLMFFSLLLSSLYCDKNIDIS